MIRIEITGLRAEGKTTIAKAIMIALGMNGVECEYEGYSTDAELETVRDVKELGEMYGLEALPKLLYNPIKVEIIDTCEDE